MQFSSHATESLGLRTCLASACRRPVAGSVVPEPADLRSRNGVLEVDLSIYNLKESSGSVLYCYMDEQGNESPNLRLKPGDLLILRLKNHLTESEPKAAAAAHVKENGKDAPMNDMKSEDACSNGSMIRDLHQSSLPWLDRPAGLPPGRRSEDTRQAR